MSKIVTLLKVSNNQRTWQYRKHLCRRDYDRFGTHQECKEYMILDLIVRLRLSYDKLFLRVAWVNWVLRDFFVLRKTALHMFYSAALRFLAKDLGSCVLKARVWRLTRTSVWLHVFWQIYWYCRCVWLTYCSDCASRWLLVTKVGLPSNLDVSPWAWAYWVFSRGLVHWAHDTGGLWGRQYGRLEAVLGKRIARDSRSRGEVMLGSISPHSLPSAYTNPKLTSWSCGLELSRTVECRLDTRTAMK